jgi:O-antigen/teichoic acid export membrane protein
MSSEPIAESVGSIPAAPGRNRSALATAAWMSLVGRSAITMLASFVATPYLLRYLGAERLGAFRTAQQWNSYLGFLYLGLGPSIVVMLLRPASLGDLNGAAAMIKSAVRVSMRQTVLVVLPAGIAMAWMMPTLLGISPALYSETRVAAFVGLVSLLLIPLEPFRSILACRQLGYLVNVALAVQALIIAGMSVWLAKLGAALVGQFAATVVGTAAFSAITIYFARLELGPAMRTPAARIDSSELWRLRWPMFLTGIGAQMNLSTDYIVVSLIAAPAAVATFSITQRMMTVLGTFVSSFSEVSWAGLAELRATGNHQAFQARVLELVRLLNGVGLVMLATFAAFNRRFVILWVGADYYGGDLLTILTAAQTMVVGYFMFFGWTIDMSGDTRYRVKVTLPGAILNVVLSVILGRRLGLYGVTLATVIAYIAGETWYSPYLFCRRYGVSLRAVAIETAKSAAIAAPWAIGVWYFANRAPASGGWSAFAVGFFSVTVAAAAYSWFAVLTRQDRAAWRSRLIALAGRFHDRGTTDAGS